MMKNNSDFLEKLEEAKSLKKEDVKEPYIPMGIYLQEAEDLHVWSRTDREKLIRSGLPEEYIDELPVYTGACRESQSLWKENEQSQEEAEKEWLVRAPEGFNFRDRLLHDFRYAYRKDDEILIKVAKISEGFSNADMVQDLNDLAVLGEKNPKPLEEINFPMPDLSLAAKESDSLATLLAAANGERNTDNDEKEMRDRMFTLLKERVDEIRECGRYVFWKNPERLKGYRSNFIRNRDLKRK